MHMIGHWNAARFFILGSGSEICFRPFNRIADTFGMEASRGLDPTARLLH